MTSVRHVTVAALAVHVSLGTVSSLLFLAAFGFRIDWLLEPARLVEGGPHAAALFRWAAVADLFSYYLPVGLVAIVLWFVLRHRNEPLATAGSANDSMRGAPCGSSWISSCSRRG